MVSIQEARKQLEQRIKQVQEAKLPTQTRAELAGRTRAGLALRQVQASRLAQARLKQLKKLKPVEVQIAREERKLKEFESLQSEIRDAKKAAEAGVVPLGFGKRVRKFFNIFISQITQQAKFLRTVKELKSAGLEPIFVDGKITGFEDLIGKRSITLPALQKELEGLTKIPKIKDVIKPTAIGLVPEIKPKEFKLPLKERAKGVIRKISGRLPAEERGVAAFFPSRKPLRFPQETLKLETPIITTDITLPPSKRGTLIFTQREKTFFEKFDINPNDPSSIKLKESFDDIQGKFNTELLTETQANLQLEKATDDFTREQLRKGLPKTAALGVAFGLLQATPLAPIVDIVLGADLFLKRNAIVQQAKKFPKETALTTATFLAGGLAGSRIGAGVKGKLSEIKIEPENLQSISFIAGKEKSKLVKSAEEIFPEVKALIKQDKITDTITYIVRLKDGKEIQVVEFSKLVGNKLGKEFVGFEVGKTPEAFIGRAIGQLKGGEGETFIRAIKFRPASTKLGRFVQRRFGSGRIIDIVERSKLGAVRRQGRTTVSEISSVAGLLRNEPARLRLVGETATLINNIKKGKNISKLQIRKLINLDRRLKGDKPFTEVEFKSTNLRTLSDTQLVNILQKVQLRISRVDLGNLKTLSERISLTKREVVGGLGETIGVRVKPKKFVERTPLSKTFGRKFKEPEILRRVKELARLKPFSKLKIVRKKEELKQVEIITPSISAVSFIAALPNRQQLFPVAEFTGSSLGLGFALTPQGVQNNLNVLKNRMDLLNKNILRLRSLEGLSSFQQENLTNASRQRLNLKLRQDLLLRLRQKLKLKEKQQVKQRTPRIPPQTPRIRIRPPTILKGVPKKKKVVKIKPTTPGIKGFNVLVKSKKKFRKQNVVSLTEKKGDNLGAFLTDRSTARTYKLVESNKKAQKPVLKVPTSYFEKNIRKFRGTRRKGKTLPLTLFGNKIEKVKFAIDNKLEKKQLSVAKLRARLFKKAKSKIKRGKK